MTEGKTVLLIDDDADFVDLNKKALEDAGYEVETAYDGEEGMQKAKDIKPDAIVLDVMMTTSTEGFEVARDMRNDPKTKHTPIIMLTSINAPEHGLPRALGEYDKDETWNPVDVFLNKPVSPEELLEKIEDALKR